MGSTETAVAVDLNSGIAYLAWIDGREFGLLPDSNFVEALFRKPEVKLSLSEPLPGDMSLVLLTQTHCW